MLSALVRAPHIICAPFQSAWRYSLPNFGGSEFVVDPRGLEFVTEPVTDAVKWIRPHTIQRAARAGVPADMVDPYKLIAPDLRA